MSQLSAQVHTFTLADFAQLRLWVIWHNEARRGGRVTKVPYGRGGKHAKSSDPSTWLTLDEAVTMAGRHRRIGVMLGAIPGMDDISLVGIDFDTCMRDGSGCEPWALDCFEAAGSTYWETSPSGTGFKAFYLTRAALEPEIRDALEIGAQHTMEWKEAGREKEMHHPPAVEISLSRRFFTITGDDLTIPLSFLSPSQALALKEACEGVFGARKRAGVPRQKSGIERKEVASPFKSNLPGTAVRGQGKAVDPFVLANIVAQIPNDERFDPRPAWVGFAHALHAAFADCPELGADLWQAHAQQREQEEGALEHVWNSTGGKDTLAGAQTLIGIARDYGIDVSEYEAAVAAQEARAIETRFTSLPPDEAPEEVVTEEAQERKVVEKPAPAQVLQAQPVSVMATIQLQPPLHEVIDQIELAVQRSGVEVFKYGEQFVRPVMAEVESFGGSRSLSVAFEVLTVSSALDVLSQVANWCRWDARAKGLVATNPSELVAKVWLSRAKKTQMVPAVHGAVSAPTLRKDASFLSTPGFDPSSKLYLAPDPNLAMPLGWDSVVPTYKEAMEGMDLLDSLLDEFPFVSHADRSIALSALMVPLLRGIAVPRPLHAFDAPSAGTGKTFLVKLATTLALGRPAPVCTAGQTEEETEKRLGAKLIAGMPVVVIDNVNGDLGGDFLCTAATEDSVDIRLLGLSRMVKIENPGCIFVTGNGLTIVGEDLVRRTLVCKQDAAMENPEMRIFKSNPLQKIMADRGRYIAAVLTAVRAHALAGCPGYTKEMAGWSSFAEYNRHVRGTLCWLGRADPLGTMWRTKLDDPKKADLGVFIRAWVLCYGYEEKTLAQAVDQLMVVNSDVSLPQSQFLSPEIRRSEAVGMFREVATRVSRGKGTIDVLNLGNWLRKQKDVVVDNHKLCSSRKTRSGVLVWKAERVNSQLKVVE
jgi:putative DNA primase/helicase